MPGGVVKDAAAKGIPVVSPDIGINSSSVYVNVRVSSIAMAKLQCHAVGRALAGKGNIYYQAGDLSSQAGKERWEGFQSCIKASYPNMLITMKESKWDANTATNQLDKVTKRYDTATTPHQRAIGRTDMRRMPIIRMNAEFKKVHPAAQSRQILALTGRLETLALAKKPVTPKPFANPIQPVSPAEVFI